MNAGHAIRDGMRRQRARDDIEIERLRAGLVRVRGGWMSQRTIDLIVNMANNGHKAETIALAAGALERARGA